MNKNIVSILLSIFFMSLFAIFILSFVHASNNNENVIKITNALHLDKNHEFVSNIFNEVGSKDNFWSGAIHGGEFVQVTFEKNLTSSNDITIYARSNSTGGVKVYEKNKSVEIADFGAISEDKEYKVYLTNLTGEQNTFDLKVSGNVEFDYIVDPSVSLTPSDIDASVKSFNPDTNFGTDTSIRVQSFSSANTRTFLRFNLSSIPSNANILSANVSLYRYNISTFAARTYNISRVTASWTETGITWNNQPAVAGTATSSTSVGATVNTSYTWNVTSDVIGFINGSYTNYGWRISDSAESSGTAYTSDFYSNNYTGNTSLLPELNIYYTDITPPTYSNNASQLVTTYTPTGHSNFSVTWNDNSGSLSGAFLESNFTGSLQNISMSGSYPTFTYNTSSLSAGTYRYRFVANDTSGNSNATATLTFTISKATLTAGSLSTPTVIYPTSVTATATKGNSAGDSDVAYQIFCGNSLIASATGSSPSNSLKLTAGSYNCVFNTTGGTFANFTSSASLATSNATVNKGNANVQISPSTQSIAYPSSVLQYCASSGTVGAVCKLYVNNIDNTTANNTNVQWGVGTFNYVANISDQTNYTNFQATSTLTVNKGILSGTFSTPTVTYPNSLAATSTISNSVGTDVAYRIYCGSTPVASSTGSAPSGSFQFGASSQNCLLNTTAGPFGNWTSNSSIANSTATVNTGILSGSISGSNVTYPTSFSITTTHSNNAGTDVTYLLWRGTTNLGTDSDSSQQSAGTYNYILNSTGGTNWTANSSIATQTFSANQNATNLVNIFFTNSSGTFQNQNITVGTAVSTTVNVTAVYSQSGTASLFEDGVSVSNSRTTTLSIGTHSYKANITGNANYTSNSTGATYYIIMLDTVPPNIQLNSPANNTYSSSSQQTFNFTTTDIFSSTTSCNLTVDGSKVNSTTATNNTPTTFVNTLAEGTHQWNVSCANPSNNLNTSETRTITIDLTKPFVSIISPTNTSYNTTTLNLNYSATDINLQTVWFQYNGLNTTLSGNTTFTALSNQPSTLTLFANDSAGNVNSTSVSFTVDTIPPNINLNLPADSAAPLPQNVTFNFTAIDNLAASMSCSIYIDNVLNKTNSTTFNNTLTNFNVNLIPEGSHNWNVSCTDTAGNMNFSATRSFIVNVTPILTSVSAPPSPIKGGNVITVSASGVDDPLNTSLILYCSESSVTPNASNTACTGGNTVGVARPYSLTCAYATAADTTTHTTTCRVYNGIYYSNVTNTTFTTDSTPPTTSIVSVAGSSGPTYYDNVNDGWTNMTINGENGMSCRWGTSNVPYSSMSNNCSISGNQATCSAVTTTEGIHFYNFYVSCKDSLGNEQNSSQNAQITNLITDWTAPTTFDNSSSTLQVPPYTVEITAQDNLPYGTANIITDYCIDTTGTCTPNIAINSGQTVTFTSANRGVNYLRYNSTDPAGNVQATQNKTININQLPVFTSASENASLVKGSGGLLITTVSSDADAGQTLKLFVCNSTSVTAAGCGGGTYCSNATAASNSSCSFAAESDSALHNWYAFIYDSVNESAATNSTGSYTTDSTVPIITIINPTNTTDPQNSITAQIDTGKATVVAEYSLDGNANVTMINITPDFWTSTISSLSNDGHTLQFFANDSVGHSATNNITFSVDTTLNDTTPPVITVWSPTNTTLTSSNVLLNITLDKNGSSAVYSLDGVANASLGNASLTDWNATVSLSQGSHSIQFFANDSSTNKNTGNSSLIFFTVDTTAPQYSTQGFSPSPANQTSNVTCFVLWTDNIALDYGIVQHNETGTATNTSQISLSGTSGWTNFTMPSSSLTPGLVECNAFAFDKGGLVNSTAVDVPVVDSIAPRVENITYTPNITTTLEPNVDPGDLVNVTADVTDNINVSTAVLQYKQTSDADWTNQTMSLVSGNTYQGNFTPTQGNWNFRIFANDTTNNVNISSTRNITAVFDETWINVSTIPAVKSIVQIQPRFFALGNLTINNTGDFDLNFIVNSTQDWISFNSSGTDSAVFRVNQSLNASLLNVSANTTGFAVGTYNFNVTIYAFDVNNSFVSMQTIPGEVVIQNVAGPFFTVTITAYNADVKQGDTGIVLTSIVSNAGTTDATGTWLAWKLPSGWTNTSGNVNESVGFLGIGSTVVNNLTVSIDSSAPLDSSNLVAFSGSNEGATGTDSKTVTTSSPSGAQVINVVNQGGGPNAASQIETLLTSGEILTTSQTIDLFRGEENSFAVNVTNIFPRASLNNVSLEVEGVLPKYVEISPSIIDNIAYNNTADFNVTITSPEYVEQGISNLTVIIVGKIVGIGVLRDFTETRQISFVRHTLTREETDQIIAVGESYVQDMENSGFPSTQMSQLLDQAKSDYNNHDYEGAQSVVASMQAERDAAFQASQILVQIGNDINKYSSITGTIASITGKFALAPQSFSQSENLVNLAQAAFQRGDYLTALQRAKDAQLTFALEKNQGNLIFFFYDNWLAIILSIVFFSALGFYGFQLYLRSTISERIKNLEKEESNIVKLMTDAQKKHYKEGTISAQSFNTMMSQYTKRISKIRELRTRLRHRRVRLLSSTELVKDLDSERRDVVTMLKKSQNDYFVKRNITKDAYDEQTRTFNDRLSEIEDDQLTLETIMAKKGKLERKKLIEKLFEKIKEGSPWSRKSKP